MRNLVILGSTGSIGTQSLDVIRRDEQFSVLGLAVHSDIEALRKQTLEFRPEVVCIYDEQRAEEFKSWQLGVRVLSGLEGLVELAAWPGADEVLVAVVGMIGIRPTLAALESGKEVALANKETLVCAGHLIMPLVRKKQLRLKPIDSEHSAIWQSLAGENTAHIEKILLTASGGPFRGKSREELLRVSREDALRHPNWSMGAKITIDSATMVNKGLEVLEASWLFDLPVDRIEVLVHPQSILHSAVQYVDGSVKGQLGRPDMRIPIEYALYAPERRSLPDERLDLCSLGSLQFERPDLELFRGLALGYEAGRSGGSMPTVYNAANEEAVALFLNGEISFLDIPALIEAAMQAHCCQALPSLEEILEIERWARDFVRTKAKGGFA